MIQFLGILIFKIIVFGVAKLTAPKETETEKKEETIEGRGGDNKAKEEVDERKGSKCIAIIGVCFGYLNKKMDWEFYWTVFCSL